MSVLAGRSLFGEIQRNSLHYLENLYQKILVGVFGIIGNSLSIRILAGTTMRNSTFNQLLVVLILFDNTFIIFAMLDYACVRGWDSKEN